MKVLNGIIHPDPLTQNTEALEVERLGEQEGGVTESRWDPRQE